MSAPILMVEWRNAVMAAELTPTTKLIAHTIGAHMNAVGKAWVSAKTLGDESGTSRRTVQRRVPDLERAGLLLVLHTRGRESNTYRAVLPTASLDDAVSTDPTASADASTASPVVSNRVTRWRTKAVEIEESGNGARSRERSYDDLPEADPSVVGVRAPNND